MCLWGNESVECFVEGGGRSGVESGDMGFDERGERGFRHWLVFVRRWTCERELGKPVEGMTRTRFMVFI